MNSRGRGRGRRGGGQGRGNCSDYKYLGECEKHNSGECRFRHELILQYVYVLYFVICVMVINFRNTCRHCMQVPPGMTVGMVIGSGGCNMKQLYRIAQCCIKVDQEKARH